MSKPQQVQHAPPTLRPQDVLLLEFLRLHDAESPTCPVCNYNLKMLTRPVCPECQHPLVLTVGVWGGRLRLGWLLIALAPGFFSGIAALFVLVPIFGRALFGDGVVMWHIIALDLFGWCSAIVTIILARRHRRFIAQPRARQRWWAIILWLIHIGALGMFMLVGYLFF